MSRTSYRSRVNKRRPLVSLDVGLTGIFVIDRHYYFFSRVLVLFRSGLCVQFLSRALCPVLVSARLPLIMIIDVMSLWIVSFTCMSKLTYFQK